ncbi:uncharacterized protein VTP21DRAFT_665 [Calcarisporiella thermophila]|uniref:uncharacterized protein n=1 Tax=Calcarisporiella thermophila TaxID=911321 RepID=UPI003742E9E4
MVLNEQFIIESFAHHLACPLCANWLQQPVTLACGISVCGSCLEGVWKSSEAALSGWRRCPLGDDCRKPVQVETRVDITLSKMVDLIVPWARSLARPISTRIPGHKGRIGDMPRERSPDTWESLVSDSDEYFGEGEDSSDTEPDFHTDYDSGTEAQGGENTMHGRNFHNDVSSSPISIATELSSSLSPISSPGLGSHAMSLNLLMPSIDGSLDSFLAQLLHELECQLCNQLLNEPITLTCGHTFCRWCLLRVLDYGTNCPVCRFSLPLYGSFHSQPTNHVLKSLIEAFFPKQIHERRTQLEAELRTDQVPLLVYSVVFPGHACFIHIFEPRYRLMLRRCLAAKIGFGFILRDQDTGYVDYGTMLRIDNVQIFPDGRALLRATAEGRFRVVERAVTDGYDTATVVPVEDDPEFTKPSANINEASEQVEKLLRFVRRYFQVIPASLAQRLELQYGPVPADNPASLSFWCGAIMPISELEKYQLMPVTSPLERLRIVSSWIDRMQQQWWFLNPGLQFDLSFS